MSTEVAADLAQRIEFVVIATDPVRTWADDVVEGPILAAVWQRLPDRYRTVLDDLVNTDPTDPACCWGCGEPVGYAEVSREDRYSREIDTVEWHLTVLAERVGAGRAVALLCEDCCPDVPSAEETT